MSFFYSPLAEGGDDVFTDIPAAMDVGSSSACLRGRSLSVGSAFSTGSSVSVLSTRPQCQFVQDDGKQCGAKTNDR